MGSRAAGLWWRLIRFGFRLLYNELAWTYDLVSWTVSLGQWREWQRCGLPHLAGQEVLELAHGPGHMLVALHDAGFKVVGCDLSPAMLRLSQKRIQANGLRIPLVRGYAQALPFVPAAFDSVFATFPAEFIIAPDTLEVIRRTLKPGGRLVIVPEARLLGRGLLRRFLAWLYEITGQRQGPLEAGAHSPMWAEAHRRFTAAGFEVSVAQVELQRSIVTVIVAQKAVG